MANNYQDFLRLKKFLKDLLGDYWVIRGSAPCLLSNLDLRLQQTLIDDYGFNEYQRVFMDASYVFLSVLDETKLVSFTLYCLATKNIFSQKKKQVVVALKNDYPFIC